MKYVINTDKSLQGSNNLEKETHNALKEAENIHDKQIQRINRSSGEFCIKINLHNEQKTTLDSCKSVVEQIKLDTQVKS